MKKYFKYIILLILVNFSFISIPETKIDSTNLDTELLENLILKKINRLRKSKKLLPYKKNKILKLAAKDQCNYLVKIDKLLHTQKNKHKKSPMKRVDFYKGNFNGVGENIAYTYLFTNVVSAKNKRISVKLTTYEQTAEHFFQLWKNSKGHYKNLISKNYNYSGIDFSINKKTNKIFSAQVFGYK